MKSLALSLALVSLANTAAIAAVSYTTYGATVSQNFDGLLTTGTANAWTNDVTLAGWHLFRQPAAAPVAIATYSTGTGSSNAGNFYSFGPAANSDRALGGVASGGAYFGSPTTGNVAGWIAVSLTNNTAITLDTVRVGFDGEQWRDGGAPTPVAQTMVLQYGIGATFGAVTTWTAPGSSFNFSSPVFSNTGTGAAVDGNVAGLSAGRGGLISGLAWNAGDTLWIRWVENNDTGNDHGLALDNFTFTAVPEPSAGLLGLIAAAYLPLRRRRK